MRRRRRVSLTCSCALVPWFFTSFSPLLRRVGAAVTDASVAVLAGSLRQLTTLGLDGADRLTPAGAQVLRRLPCLPQLQAPSALARIPGAAEPMVCAAH